MPGVNEVQTREMKADEAIIAVNYNGNGKALAEALMLKTFGSFGLNITKTTPKNVHVVLIAK